MSKQSNTFPTSWSDTKRETLKYVYYFNNSKFKSSFKVGTFTRMLNMKLDC